MSDQSPLGKRKSERRDVGGTGRALHGCCAGSENGIECVPLCAPFRAD